MRFPSQWTALLLAVRRIEKLDRLDELLRLAKTADFETVHNALLAEPSAP